MRPTSLDDFIGHDKVIGIGKMLRTLLDSNQFLSMILWGPPGCGKVCLTYHILRLRRCVRNLVFHGMVCYIVKHIVLCYFLYNISLLFFSFARPPKMVLFRKNCYFLLKLWSISVLWHMYAKQLYFRGMKILLLNSL